MQNISTKELLSILGLVEKIAAKYAEGSNVPVDRLQAVGMLGFKAGFRAYVEKERWKDDMKLSTYLSWWIKTAIEKYLGIESDD